MTDANIKGFFNSVESLKKYRRADLISDTGDNILDELYTDLLPNDFVIKKCLLDNTTILIGRKGTGKSTIFLKLENELKKKKDHMSIYIDVKTIYESTNAMPSITYLENYVDKEHIDEYIIQRLFIQNVLDELQKRINEKAVSIVDRIKGNYKSPRKVKQQLKELYLSIIDNEYLKKIEIPVITKSFIANDKESYNGKEVKLALKLPKLKIDQMSSKITMENDSEISKSNKKIDNAKNSEKYSEIFMKIFQIKNIILKIKEILKNIGINHLVILLDDLSEIDDKAIITFIDTIVAPLNNWSDEFIKFKIAAYPNRLHYGNIDPSKIDIINLDFYNLYSAFDRNKMEEYSIDFTKRLIEKRIRYYCKCSPELFFDLSKCNLNTYYELLFKVSMNVPRIMGYILSYCFQNCTNFKKPITQRDIEIASSQYYNEKICMLFSTTTYSIMAINEKISIFQLKELMESLVYKMANIKRRIISRELKGDKYISSSPYTSHFYIDPKYERYLETLELNHFISKYDELIDKDGKSVNIYCLNYGLCIKNSLLWGKPKGKTYRQYFIQRVFDFNSIIQEFLTNSQQIVCVKCKKQFTSDQLPFLEFNNFRCNDCGGTVEVKPILSENDRKLIANNAHLALPTNDASIILFLKNATTPLYARDISEELDLSSQYIGRRCKILSEEKGLVIREKISAIYSYELSDEAKKIYTYLS